MIFWTLVILTFVCSAATLLPLSRHEAWWIRVFDFPRVQIFALNALTGIAVAVLLETAAWPPRVLLAATVACCLYQAWWIFPYTPLARREVKAASPGNNADRIRLLSVNVLMPNHRAEALLAIVRAEDPDVLVTLETNGWWEERLRPLEKDYPHRLRCPLENLYGMHLYSRLPLEDAKIQFLVESDLPSMHQLVVLRSGRKIRLHCLHPAPPSPTENLESTERDAELVMVGKNVARATRPVIVTGDLNDVAWSTTTRLFRKTSGLLDPRIGRGMFNTFHTGWPLFRWPVDHVFHSKDFTLVKLKRLPAFGSDHFPMLVELQLEPREDQAAEGLAKDADAEELAREKLDAENVEPSQVHAPGERAPDERAPAEAPPR